MFHNFISAIAEWVFSGNALFFLGFFFFFFSQSPFYHSHSPYKKHCWFLSTDYSFITDPCNSPWMYFIFCFNILSNVSNKNAYNVCKLFSYNHIRLLMGIFKWLLKHIWKAYTCIFKKNIFCIILDKLRSSHHCSLK